MLYAMLYIFLDNISATHKGYFVFCHKKRHVGEKLGCNFEETPPTSNMACSHSYPQVDNAVA